MIKETYYFSHDYNARNDKKLIKVKQRFRMAGIGTFWCLIEMLYEEGGKLLMDDIDMIATELKEKNTTVLAIINDFDLFKNDGSFFWSNSANNRLAKRKEKSEKASASAQERWRNANAMRTHTDGNAIKERKGKENKGKQSKVNDENGDKSPAPVINLFKQISKDEFFNEVAVFKNDYSKEMLRAFFDYWSELSPGGKMRFQLEKTWETKKRLITWQTRDAEKNLNNGSHKQTSSGNNKKSGISSDRIEALKNF